jgi:hypothetical protein
MRVRVFLGEKVDKTMRIKSVAVEAKTRRYVLRTLLTLQSLFMETIRCVFEDEEKCLGRLSGFKR